MPNVIPKTSPSKQTPAWHKGRAILPQITLQNGETLQNVTVAYETWGELNEHADNVILLTHALTGDAHAGYGEEQPGWWEPLIGPGRALDTNRYYVIASNVLGGCNGSLGPSSLGSDQKPYALRFPLFTIRDMVKTQEALLLRLAIKRLALVAGGSLGGMQVWEWLRTDKIPIQKALIIAASSQFSPLAIGYNALMREAIIRDPYWHHGNYYAKDVKPASGLKLARMAGMLTYRSHQDFASRQWRDRSRIRMANSNLEAFMEPLSPVETYLHYQGEKLVRRFDANSYLYLTRAMDMHDIRRDHESLEEALATIKTDIMLVGIDTDYLYPSQEIRQITELAQQVGIKATYAEIQSPYGHDAFLLEWDRLQEILAEALAPAVTPS